MDKIKKTKACDCGFMLLISLEHGCVNTLDRVKEYFVRWMKQRQQANEPYLTGVIIPTDYMFMGEVPNAGMIGRFIPVALFQGEASSLISQGMGSQQIEDLLTELACFCGLGSEFGPKWAQITVGRDSITLQA